MVIAGVSDFLRKSERNFLPVPISPYDGARFPNFLKLNMK
jgi:hypothetical protein